MSVDRLVVERQKTQQLRVFSRHVDGKNGIAVRFFPGIAIDVACVSQAKAQISFRTARGPFFAILGDHHSQIGAILVDAPLPPSRLVVGFGIERGIVRGTRFIELVLSSGPHVVDPSEVAPKWVCTATGDIVSDRDRAGRSPGHDCSIVVICLRFLYRLS